MATTVVAARVPEDHARALREIARLRRTWMSGVLAQLVVEQVAPLASTDAGAEHDEAGLDG